MLDRALMAAALPGYEIGRELGRGGWGIVVAGRHRALGRRVAIKQLPRAFGSDEATRQRFLNEARTIARLNHPHIVDVYDFVEHEGLCLIVMELLHGGTLWKRFSETGVEADEAVAVAVAVATALHAAHEEGVVHRDVKPENIFFGGGGSVKLGDFGIAKVLDFGGDLTAVGETVGTPAYMSPEQATQRDLGPASDQYSLGVVLYEMLSGRLPFPPVTDAVALLYQHVHEEPEPLPPSIPQPLAGVVTRALAKRPEDRFGSAEVFATTLVDAANDTFGSRWLHHTDLAVLSSGPVADAVARGTGQPLLRAPTYSIAAVSEHARVGTVFERPSAAPTAHRAAAADPTPEAPSAAAPSSRPPDRPADDRTTSGSTGPPPPAAPPVPPPPPAAAGRAPGRAPAPDASSGGPTGPAEPAERAEAGSEHHLRPLSFVGSERAGRRPPWLWLVAVAAVVAVVALVAAALLVVLA